MSQFDIWPGDDNWSQTYRNFVESYTGSLSALTALVNTWATVEEVQVRVAAVATFVDADTFTMPGDQTAYFQNGTKTTVGLADGAMKWTTVASASYAGGTTTVNLSAAILSDPIYFVLVVVSRDGNTPYGPGYINARDYGVPGQAALEAADAAIGVLDRELVLVPGTWSITSNCEVDSTIRPIKGAVLSVATGVTLTINSIIPFPFQMIELNGTAQVVFAKGAAPYYYPEMFGAVGDGATDDRVALQGLCDALTSGGTINLIKEYSIGRAKAPGTWTTDRYGVYCPNSDITFVGGGGCLFRRDDLIVDAADAYPIFFVGVPDSDDSDDQISNVKFLGVNFEGSDVRHSTSGSAPMDWRDAIHVRNCKNLEVLGGKFTKVDSTVMYVRQAGYVNNTTKCYDIKFNGNQVYAEPHAVAGRAYIHALMFGGVDGAQAIGNYFEWCDNAITDASTYQYATQDETDTYTDTAYGLGAGIKRGGRDFIVANNTIYNSSEHCLYVEGKSLNVHGNRCWVDDTTICPNGDIKVRGQGLLDNNTVIAKHVCLSISEPTYGLTVSRTNQFHALASPSADSQAMVDITSAQLKAFIDAHADYMLDYSTMRDIVIEAQLFPFATASLGSAIRIYTSISPPAPYDVSREVVNLRLAPEISKCRVGIYFINPGFKDVSIQGARMTGQDFTVASWDSETTMGGYIAIAFDEAAATAAYNVDVTGCRFIGFTNLFGWIGSVIPNAQSMYPPCCKGNEFSYIKFLRQHIQTNIAGLSKAAACVVSWTGHGLATNDLVGFHKITQDADWEHLNSNMYLITWINADSFSIPVNTSGYTDAYNTSDPGEYFSYKTSLFWDFSTGVFSFLGNRGRFIVDRLFPVGGGNTLSDYGDGVNSFKRGTFNYTGGHLYVYPNDSGSGVQLD